MSGDESGDTSPDLSGDGRWLTYAELAELRGIDKASAERLVHRNRWRRQRGNRCEIRVLLPLDYLSGNESGDGSGDISGDLSPDVGGDFSATISVLQGVVTALTERARELESRADRAEAARDGERARADALRDKIEVLQAELVAKGVEAEQAGIRARTAEEAAEVLRRAEAERQARGPLRRAWDVWRGR